MAPDGLSEKYPLYNTTFTIHRLSSLYTGERFLLNNAVLRQHARRFRDILAGEVLRGVRVGLAPEEDVLARAGALQTVTWRLLSEEAAWTTEDETELGNDDATVSLAPSRGMVVAVTYENMVYKAVLLRLQPEGPADESRIHYGETEDGFEYFPLLLLRMPASLRETFADFLGTTFDTRVSNLHLPSKFMTNAFEKYLSDVSVGEDGDILDVVERSKALRTIIREVMLVIGFDMGESSNLKNVDIQIAREDLLQMIAKGMKIGSSIDGHAPFFNALSAYVKAHLALDLKHEMVKILRIACGAFVLGSEGKIKLTQPGSGEDGDSSQSRATRRLINGLITAARGGNLSVASGIP